MTASECERYGKFVGPAEDVIALNANPEDFEKGDVCMQEESYLDKGGYIKSTMPGLHSNAQFNTVPQLIILCGPTHSGKSSFAKKLEDFVIVSSDKIRKEITGEYKLSDEEDIVWKTFSACKVVALKNKKDIVLDACHLSSRARWHALKGVNDNYRKICIVFDLPLRKIEQRCLREKRISLETAREMWKSFQKSIPSEEELKQEGFDEVHFVKSPIRCYVEKKPLILKPEKNCKILDKSKKEVKP